MEFRQPVQQYQYVSRAQNTWQPGGRYRFPYMGIGALLGALAALCACVVILAVSDGKPISSWSIQPSVYLAIAVPIVNILVTFALSEGVDIAWWRKALSSGTTIRDLHQTWAFGKSFKSALLAGQATNLIALASILAVVSQINSPLLQRASTVVQRTHTFETTVNLLASPDLPNNYLSGYISGRAYDVTLYTSQYAPVVSDFDKNASFQIAGDHGCQGSCKARMRALGLAVDCSDWSVPFDLNPLTVNGKYNVSIDPAVNGTYVFYADIFWDLRDPRYINVTTLYKDNNVCSGILNGESCSITTATVDYSTIVDGRTDTISLDPATTVWDDEVINKTTTRYSLIQGGNPLAGYYLALLNKYNTSTHMRWTGAVGYTMFTTGAGAQQYAILDPNAGSRPGTNCTVGYSNPMNDILAGARDLMFRTSLAIPQYNASLATRQSQPATDVLTRAVFQSNYWYLSGAVVITLVAMLSVLVIFRGYSVLGRSISLSPIEVAKAFNAPLLANQDSNLPIDELIRDVGDRSVRYGTVQTGGGSSAAAQLKTGYIPYSHDIVLQEVDMSSPARLCMADEDIVSVPRRGQAFTGR